MKKISKKLYLSRETVRPLTSTQVSRAAGGATFALGCTSGTNKTWDCMMQIISLASEPQLLTFDCPSPLPYSADVCKL